MIGFRRILLVIAATAALATTAWAEMIIPVNEAGTGSWVFDQPAVAVNGTVIHVAYVGDNSAGAAGSPNTRLYFASINGGADFTNKLLTRGQVLLTAPLAIDDALFTSARHPQIALRTSTELVILFQAIPVGDSSYKLFRAILTIGNNVVTSQRVDEIRDAAGARIPGNLTDPSFNIVTIDNTLRVSFASFPSLVAGSPYSDVYYARVGQDNARVANNAILLTNTTGTTGVTPLPRLRIDSNNFSHIAWAANNNDPTRTTPAGIYYAMVHAVAPSVVDNLAIGATQVLLGGYRWGFPCVLASGSTIWILAADEPFGPTGLAGSVGITQINPYNVVHDGNPVNVNNVGANASFFPNPPGGTVLPASLDVYQPEAAVDSQGRLNVTGYGFRSADGHGTPGKYYVTSFGSSAPGTSVSPVSVGIGDIAFATQLPGDYTRPAFVHFTGKAVQFWSGPDDVVTDARNLYVTSVLGPADPTTQSGCATVDDPRRGEEGRIPGAAVLLLPAALLALRRAGRKAFAR